MAISSLKENRPATRKVPKAVGAASRPLMHFMKMRQPLSEGNATTGTPAEEKFLMIVNLFSINHLQKGRKHIQGWNGPIYHRPLMSGLSRLA